MLRSGYSSEAVLRELSTRHFTGDFDSAGEEQLARAGANQSLIRALQSGAYAAPSSEIAAAQEKLAAREKQSAPATEQSSKLKASPPTTPATSSSDAIYRLLEHDLVSLQRGELKPFDDKAIAEKKLYLFFFSANTSAFARKFTPYLVEYYNRVAPHHPEFETIFFSKDRSPFGMENYMRQTNMPWPAVVWDKVASKEPAKTAAADLPVLIVVTAGGRVLYNSSGSENANLGKVTADLDQILTTGSANPLAPPPGS